MLGENIITELLKLSVVTGLLGFIAYTLWRRFDDRVKEMKEDLKELRTRYDNEVIVSRKELSELVRDNTDVFEELKAQNRITNTILTRSANVMECLTVEIKKIKPEFVGK